MSYLFTTNKLGFRLLQQEDIEACKLFWGNKEVMNSCGGSMSLELLPDVLSFYKQSQLEYGLSVYGVVLLETEEVIGAAGFNIEDSLKNAELICHLKKDIWNKGYGTEAAIACLNYAHSLNLVQTITASSAINNKQALRILGKVGFDYKGIQYVEDIKQEEAFFSLTFN
ncbi:GNAT family N-acetyltransferase [Niallia sp. NCCP-28]|uniref:GNAT family N-acetyltransferase n=1 Tax=Niallia sp. NCCP-28 TaxID=2934712 RepID=UPI002083562E|nr:GNAT family N-acetyltransferase [Niallia sp. NCCP-28]GKU82658.1 hypothetical protein NCCP28_20540 [Niallia sp. NCCP-28]